MLAVRETLPRADEDARCAAPDFAALVGRVGWFRLHRDIRRRFEMGHAAKPVVYRGVMRLDRSVIGLVFAAAARLVGGPLPMRAASKVPTEVGVYGDGRGGIVWERWLRFARGRAACVRSTKRSGLGDTLLECVDGGLGMVLSVFEEGGALVFESRSYFLHFAGLRLPIPAFATPGRCRVTHSAEGPDTFRFTMEMVHPLWGRTFRQTGVFKDPES
jgi:hypothetical protein